MSNLEPCPRCNSVDTCNIVYEYPDDIEEHLKLVAERKIHLGSSSINSSRYTRYCNNCENTWGEIDSDKIDSFDYDQGFNIEEVYDQ